MARARPLGGTRNDLAMGSRSLRKSRARNLDVIRVTAAARGPRKAWAVRSCFASIRARSATHRFALVARASQITVRASQIPVVEASVFHHRPVSVTLRFVDTSIELRYAGVVIGKATVSGPVDESGDKSVFVPVPDPLPVGTKVGLKIDDRTLEGRVIGVAESTDSSKCGMKVRIGGAAKTGTSTATSASDPAPAPAATAAGAPSAPAPSMDSAPVDGAVVTEGDVDVSVAHGDGSSDGVPGAGDGGGPSGAQGGGRRRRRRR
jgi:hypothetical protein